MNTLAVLPKHLLLLLLLVSGDRGMRRRAQQASKMNIIVASIALRRDARLSRLVLGQLGKLRPFAQDRSSLLPVISLPEIDGSLRPSERLVEQFVSPAFVTSFQSGYFVPIDAFPPAPAPKPLYDA
ncbi:hypothetical protein [Bradyrhizobium glycinis]|uniref:hypothetical protein n=1 Tax=Bradyrhizobium glycinis TaxID=2751812 RepID=UPI0018D648FB|nr:hypothetical protein [Bradyrhizobium glycinis]MBH5371475.1 hypothetical protein [Bradyrhizobium glycinis]